MSISLGVLGFAIVDNGVCAPKVLDVYNVVGMLRTAAMLAKLWS
jgi:hypothetical protein